MSINVTVTGNPISIQKGRMVTASPNHSKKEFDRRRLIRISQVRQQSKNIAEDVRNRVKKQKLKQIEEIEKEGQKKLKQWQARKLLELQNQCHEALKDIGAGHKEASLLEDEENLLLDKRKNDEEVAKKRAEVAAKKMQDEKNELKHNASVPILKRKFVRQMENRRARMISGLKHSSESIKRKTVDKLSINTEVSGIVTESDSDHEDIDMSLTKEKSADNSIEVVDNSKSLTNNLPLTSSKEVANDKQNPDEEEKLVLSDSDDQLLKELREQKDTRISDHIRRRSSHQLTQPDLCDTLTNNEKRGMNLNKGCGERDSNNSRSKDMFSSIQQNIYACSCSKPSPVVQSPACRCGTNRIPSARKPAVTNINNLKCFDTTDEEESFRKTKENQQSNVQKTRSRTVVPSFTPKKRVPVKEIPTRPKVTLKSVKSPVRSNSGSTSQTNLQKKQSQSKFIASHVERIDRECLVISPEVRNNDEFLEKVRERDREAIIRGQKALEKERLQREYNEMMKKLPALQKLERLYEMNQDKPEYHMTEERLREQEKKKQSILDDTYEKLFPDRRPPPITIPVKNPSKSTITDREKVGVDENCPSLNLGIWESGRKSKKLYTEEEVEAMLREGKSESKFKTDQLKSVLEKLRKQKEEILKEIKTQQLSETLPFSTSTKGDVKRVRNSSESSISSDTSRKGQGSEKKFVSVKVGTNSLQSSSSYDTVEEPVAKKSKSVKRTAKFESKSVQVAGISKKTKSPAQKSQKHPKIVVKEQKTREISSSGERSTADLKRCSSAESARSNQIKKRAEKDHAPSVPTNSLVSVDSDPVKSQSNQIKSCDCEKDVAKKSAELCEIVIKIKDGKSSEVKIKEGKKDKTEAVLEKSSAKKPDKTKEAKSNQRLNEIKKALNDDCCQSSKPESWHDKFLKNNSQVSTSSTSYMSPPHLPNKPLEKPRVTPYFCDLIGKKPQQLNLNGISPTAKKSREDLFILGEVQKVLAMSRQSIDELGVSSVSTVTTPSQSVIDLESNRVNTSTAGLSTSRAADSGPSHSRSTLPNFSFLSVSSENRTIVASEMDSNEPYPDVLAKYARIAEQCSQRISDLTSMIDKVRQDKNKMLQTSSLLTTNDSTTKYMDLPSPNKSTNAKDPTKEQRSMSSSSSGDSKLLDINFSLADRLRGMTPEEVKNFGKGVDRNDCVNDSKGEEELVKRFKALKETPSVIDDKKGKEVETVTKTSEKDGSEDTPPPKQSNPEGNIDFIPLLLDIPKMPALAVDSSGTKHKKPPPSKSFMAARKFTDFIAPHELSTIPEQDSQMKLDSTLRDRSPKEQRISEVVETVPTPKKLTPLENKASTHVNKEKPDNNVKIITKEYNTAVSRSSSSPVINQSKNSSSKTKESVNNSDYSFGSSNTSGDEKVEMLRIEAMLRSIGMDWAISTLRKTQEALALTSSSSSIDVNSPSIMKNLSDSDIKEYLSKQMFQKISSSTLRTDASPGSLNESREFSDIRHSDFVYKQTSTPVNRSRELPKSHEKSSDLPSAIESDKISNDFFSLPEHSP